MTFNLVFKCLTEGFCLILNLQGFSAGLFAFYRDDDGKPLTTRYADGLPPFNERYFIFLNLSVLSVKGCFQVAFLDIFLLSAC